MTVAIWELLGLLRDTPCLEEVKLEGIHALPTDEYDYRNLKERTRVSNKCIRTLDINIIQQNFLYIILQPLRFAALKNLYIRMVADSMAPQITGVDTHEYTQAIWSTVRSYTKR